MSHIVIYVFFTYFYQFHNSKQCLKKYTMQKCRKIRCLKGKSLLNILSFCSHAFVFVHFFSSTVYLSLLYTFHIAYTCTFVCVLLTVTLHVLSFFVHFLFVVNFLFSLVSLFLAPFFGPLSFEHKWVSPRFDLGEPVNDFTMV